MEKHRRLGWKRLENVAKIFPSTSNKIDTKVFRFACELYEEVDAKLLQQALDKTLRQFPLYRSILKKGLFWYYLEETEKLPLVKKESEYPCRQIYKQDGSTLLFHVTYYHKRINLEVFHALTDGTGALNFLRTMVFYYIALAHPQEFSKDTVFSQYDASQSQRAEDSFDKYFSGKTKSDSRPAPKAHQIRGERFIDYRLGVIEGRMSAKALVAKAKEYGGTVTSFLTAVLVNATKETMSLRERKKPVVVEVPVNLRQFFPSKSARNFFGVIDVGYSFADDDRDETDLKDILTHITSSFQENLTISALKRRMNQLSALERGILTRMVPLFIKNLALRLADHLQNQRVTLALSNLGKVEMPEAVMPFIRLFDVFVSTHRVQACMCTFKDELMISITSSFVQTDIQRNFFRALSEMGIEVEVTTNIVEDEEDRHEILP